jgi:hypothetical protein
MFLNLDELNAFLLIIVGVPTWSNIYLVVIIILLWYWIFLIVYLIVQVVGRTNSVFLRLLSVVFPDKKRKQL